MDIRICKKDDFHEVCDTLVLAFKEGLEVGGKLNYLSDDIEATISYLVREEIFTGKSDQIESFRTGNDDFPKNVILVGMGAEDKIDSFAIKKAVSKAIKEAKKMKAKAIEMFPIGKCIGMTLEDVARVISETVILADYEFDKYKSDKKESTLREVNIIHRRSDDLGDLEKGILEGKLLGEATVFARDLVNEPSNIMTPEALAEKAIHASKCHGFETQVLNLKEITDLKMESFISVAKGSVLEPKLIVMRHIGNPNSNEKYALVGKGLTYDSGGYAIKPAESMASMKSDMGGAAAVIGAMAAISSMKLPINVVGIIAACENMISGNAYRNGDIIGSMSGKFIEVVNTDAEGRLTLADALTYAIEKENATKVLDIATLTGAALVALGTSITPVVASNDEFFSILQKASIDSGEKIWRLPADDELKELLKSDVADLKNSAGRYGGTITAGLFLKEFTKDLPWLHLDIAGSSWAESASSICPKGGTGAGVRILYHLIKNLV